MLMRSFTPHGGDFNQMIHQRFLTAGGGLFLGGLTLVLSGTVLMASDLPDFAKGVYCGLGAALVFCSVCLLIHTFWLKSHPNQARTALIKQQDERERLVNEKAMQWSFCTVYFLILPAMLVAVPLNMSVFWVLYTIFMCMSLIWLVGLPIARRIL